MHIPCVWTYFFIIHIISTVFCWWKRIFNKELFFLFPFFLLSSNFSLLRSSRFPGNMPLDMAGILTRTPLCSETGPSIQVRDKSRHQWTLSPITYKHGLPNTGRYCCKLWAHMTKLQYMSPFLSDMLLGLMLVYISGLSKI